MSANQHTGEVTKIAKYLSAHKSLTALKQAVRGILTEGEIEECGRRLEIVRLLKKGTPQHKIALMLNVGVATVTRGARELKLGRFKQV
jgi:TrpR family trp operon transcriptional repressor